MAHRIFANASSKVTRQGSGVRKGKIEPDAEPRQKQEINQKVPDSPSLGESGILHSEIKKLSQETYDLKNTARMGDIASLTRKQILEDPEQAVAVQFNLQTREAVELLRGETNR